MKTKCLSCGTEFEGRRETGLCSPECRRKWRAKYSREWSKTHAAPKKPGEDAPLDSGRRCPDCGKPITDYRCPKCWAKRRAAQGLPINGESMGYEEFDI